MVGHVEGLFSFRTDVPCCAFPGFGLFLIFTLSYFGNGESQMVRVRIMPQETFIIVPLYNVSSCSQNFSSCWALPCLFYEERTNECTCLMNNIKRWLTFIGACMMIVLIRKQLCLLLPFYTKKRKGQISYTLPHVSPLIISFTSMALSVE